MEAGIYLLSFLIAGGIRVGFAFWVRVKMDRKGYPGFGWWWLGFWACLVGLIIACCMPERAVYAYSDNGQYAQKLGNISAQPNPYAVPGAKKKYAFETEESKKNEIMRHYNQMLKDGVITSEEHAAKKQELFGTVLEPGQNAGDGQIQAGQDGMTEIATGAVMGWTCGICNRVNDPERSWCYYCGSIKGRAR